MLTISDCWRNVITAKNIVGISLANLGMPCSFARQHGRVVRCLGVRAVGPDVRTQRCSYRPRMTRLRDGISDRATQAPKRWNFMEEFEESDARAGDDA